MENQRTKIRVETTVSATLDHVWNCWTEPEHIINWYHASDDWHTTKAENNLKAGGKFIFRMEAKDGSFGFDFCGVYDRVQLNKTIEYSIADGRKVVIAFSNNDNETRIVETFEAEDTNSIELQRTGWQSIINNFNKYTETKLK